MSKKISKSQWKWNDGSLKFFSVRTVGVKWRFLGTVVMAKDQWMDSICTGRFLRAGRSLYRALLAERFQIK